MTLDPLLTGDLREAAPTSTPQENFGLAEKGNDLTNCQLPLRAVREFYQVLPHSSLFLTIYLLVFCDASLSAVSSDVGVDSPRGISHPRGLMAGYAAEGQSDSPHCAQDPAMSGRGHSTGLEPPPYPRPLTTRHMQPNSPPYNPAFNNAQNPGYPAGIPSSSLPFGGPSLPYDQRTDFRQFPQQSINLENLPSFAYPHPYRPPGIPDSGTMSHNVHTNYQIAVQAPQTFQFNEHPREGPSGPYRPFPNVGPYPHARSPPHQSSPPLMPGGYASIGHLHPVNYSPSNSSPPYGYPPPQGYSPSPPMYPPYNPSPYNQPRSPEADRQGTWWYSPHNAAVPLQQQFDGTAGYRNDYSGSYPMHPQINSYHASAASPSISPPISSKSIRLASPERRLNVGASSIPGSEGRGGKKPLVRRSYHPSPPAYRSEWVMWAGNVPSDATHDELWRFFTKFPEGTPDAPAKSGVLSIFLISRSNCAFVNYEDEPYLNAAIEHFNGRSLRPGDSRCPKLVCRIRRRDDDLKAGVGGQRGIGMHMRWIKEQKARAAEEKGVLPTTETSSVFDDASSDVLPEISSLSISSDDDPGARRRPQSLGSSSSYASTNSSLLSWFFPQRYFILKSLTQFDLDLSKEKGLWATQKHNEGILDQAFRTSQDVYLIFSVNKSGEFYGYARMAGPIRRGGHKVSWALRSSDSVSPGPSLSLSTDEKGVSPGVPTKRGQGNLFFSPGASRFVDESPLSVSGDNPKQEAGPLSFPLSTENVQSAPAVLGAVHPKITTQTPSIRHSLDHMVVQSIRDVPPPDEDFELDPMAPLRAMRSGTGDSPVSMLEAVAEETERGGNDVMKGGEGKGGVEKGEERDEWGEPFKLEWISTEKISFQKTRHIRNPWNHDREVKVSRDGTELEPSVGRKLIEEWALLARKQ
ncbi:hypothetical protein C0995_014233 [Termitomyces sp. Mi166|nr:hypothetical protein C0995_014233 [Termitomyces sp. Mi166\